MNADSTRQLVRSIASEIAPLDKLEVEHRADVLDWIDSGAEIFRTAKPATPPKHLVSYCVLVDAQARQILLVDHRDAERWLPTGGHVEPGEDPGEAASREIREELGISPSFHQIVGNAPLMVTVTQTGGVSQSHVDVSLWYVFEAPTTTTFSPDKGEFAEVRWWSLEDITNHSDTRFDPHLPRFVAKLMAATAQAG